LLITLTYEPDADSGVDATVLGHLLHKHPAKAQTFSLPVGDVHVFYPEATAQRCTIAALLEVDPIALVRSKRFKGDAGTLDHYVNDRPYAAAHRDSRGLDPRRGDGPRSSRVRTLRLAGR